MRFRAILFTHFSRELIIVGTANPTSEESIRVKPEQGELMNLGIGNMKGLTLTGEFKAVYDEDEDGYVLELDPQDVEFEGESLQALQQRLNEQEETEELPEVQNDPVFAKKDGYEWVGLDISRDHVVTEKFETLEDLKAEFGAKTSTRVGRDEQGNNVYQLIYPVEEAA